MTTMKPISHHSEKVHIPACLVGLKVRKSASRWGHAEYLTPDDIRARLIERVEHDTNGGCWLWPVNHLSHGHAVVVIGRIGEGGIKPSAHRLSYELFVGPIPEGMHVCHKCDVPCCINPAHLFLGTHADNMADMSAKGRSGWHTKRQSVVTAGKLTRGQADEIRKRRVGGEPLASLCLEFGIKPQQVWKIATGRQWK